MCPHTGRWQQTVNKHCDPPTMPKGSGKIHQTVPHPISHEYGQKRWNQVWGGPNRRKRGLQ